MNKQIAVYDNTVSARTYIGYIAEQAGGFAVIGRDGKLYIKTFGQGVIDFNIELFGDYTWGDKFKISKVSYEDGIQDFKYGTEEDDTLYINQNNVYIINKEQVENIYNQVKNFEAYSFEGNTIIDPAYDIGDILVIEGKQVIYQGELEYASKFKANIKSIIQAKTEQESMQTKESTKASIRKIKSTIDQENLKIEQIIQENSEHEEKLTQHDQDINGLKQSVSNTIDYKREKEGVTEVHLDNAEKGYILKFEIQGNKTYENYLYPSENLYPSSNLYPNMEGSELI